jgi:hypothetical protein
VAVAVSKAPARALVRRLFLFVRGLGGAVRLDLERPLEPAQPELSVRRARGLADDLGEPRLHRCRNDAADLPR